MFRRHASLADTDDPLALVQYLDLKTYLVGDINTKVDRASMAHSLEVREPLMDHPLVEWLGDAAVRRSRCAKARASGCSRRPGAEASRRRALPSEDGVRRSAGALVPRPAARPRPRRDDRERLADTGIFEPAYLRRLCDDHQSGVRDYSAPLWTLMMFDAFLRNVVDAGSTRPSLERAA